MAKALAKELGERNKLAKTFLSAFALKRLMGALGMVAERLDAAGVPQAAKDLRVRLDGEIDPEIRRSLVEALGIVGKRLDSTGAAETAKDLIARFDRKDVDPGYLLPGVRRSR